jgi:hypothetical protein
MSLEWCSSLRATLLIPARDTFALLLTPVFGYSSLYCNEDALWRGLQYRLKKKGKVAFYLPSSA